MSFGPQRVAVRSACTGIAVCATLIAGGAYAQSVGLARAAIDRHNGVSLHKWRFDRLRQVGRTRIRERCIGVDFHKADCRLMTVDDAAPDDKALERYAKATPQPVTDNLPNLDPLDFVDAQSLSLDAKDGNDVRFTFKGAAATPEDYVREGSVTGELIVEREDGYIQTLSIRNREAFRPALGVNIAQFRVDVEFVTIDEQVFARRVEMQVQGRAFGLKKIAQHERFEFENFTPPQ